MQNNNIDYARGIDKDDLINNTTDIGFLPDYDNPCELNKRGGLSNVISKLKAGKEVTIAYLGGSITQQEGWRPRTTNWLRNRYPDARINEINAGVSGTGSAYGVARLEDELFQYPFDLLFVEFAVNDGGVQRSRILNAMEGIVRKVWKKDAAIDICFVYTVDEASMKIYRASEGTVFQPSAAAQDEIAGYYGIPSVNFAYIVTHLEKKGELIFKSSDSASEAEQGKIIFSRDGVHPLAGGDQLYAGAVARAFIQMEKNAVAVPHILGAPLNQYNWENAKAIPMSDLKADGNWKVLTADLDAGTYNSEYTDNSGVYVNLIKRLAPKLLKSNTPGDYIEVRFRGTAIGIMDVGGPYSGQLEIVVDGGAPFKVSRFTPYNSYMRHQYFYLDEMEDCVHTIKFTLDSEAPDKMAMLINKKDYDENPGKYRDNLVYFGKLLLIGDLL